MGIYLINSVNPFRLEGQKSIMLRVLGRRAGGSRRIGSSYPAATWGIARRSARRFFRTQGLGLITKVPRWRLSMPPGANTLHVLVNEKKLKWNKGTFDQSMVQKYLRSTG